MRHNSHVGHWIVIDGVRTSYRGKLLAVVELGTEAILQMHPCYALEALSDTNGEVKVTSSDDAPFEIYSGACLAVGRQPATWAKT
jgi:hypothetical protein